MQHLKNNKNESGIKPWFIYGQRALSLCDRLKILLGFKLYVRFDSPNGECSAACSLSHHISRRAVDKIEWPNDTRLTGEGNDSE